MSDVRLRGYDAYYLSNQRQRKVRRRRRTLLALLVLVALGGATSGRLLTQSPPTLKVSVVLADSTTFPGVPPAPDWPAQGQAAVAVVGLGNVGQFGPPTPQPIASVAKMMTAYLILRDFPLTVGAGGFQITIDAADVSDLYTREAEGQSTVPIVQGEQLDELQLLQALLIPSGNNIAPILADYDAGSVSAFVAKMNTEARSLGMVHTTYTDPSGFDATTVSTASDQLILAQVVMREPVFAQVVGLRSVTLPEAGTVTNFDTLLGDDGFVGIKTGSDSTAGGCFVFDDHRVVDGRTVEIVGVVLGQDVGEISTQTLVGAALGSSRNLADSVAKALSVQTVVPAGSRVLEIDNPDGANVYVTTTRPLTELGWGRLRIPLRLTYSQPGKHLKVGQSLASLDSSLDPAAAVFATAAATMPGPSAAWRAEHFF